MTTRQEFAYRAQWCELRRHTPKAQPVEHGFVGKLHRHPDRLTDMVNGMSAGQVVDMAQRRMPEIAEGLRAAQPYNLRIVVEHRIVYDSDDDRLRVGSWIGLATVAFDETTGEITTEWPDPERQPDNAHDVRRAMAELAERRTVSEARTPDRTETAAHDDTHEVTP